jgi:catechol 2,3-dioxygenase-like lactoylglutathione lyase family enzyme
MLRDMVITKIATQVRVADLERALRFYVQTLGFEEDFRFRDFYAGLRAGGTSIHLKQVDTTDPSIAFVQEGDHMHQECPRNRGSSKTHGAYQATAARKGA